ncbi:response regulator transcription factor [Bifidobacterium sp. ESL0732]|uniref:response regulator transcription factor n=1 Tax=Bifidobacterium sp. ESL0732 TaxID=2983222 RepID=UPI0023FA0A2B|nr:response regulator transcription factor [Bifidobacterium sp. ESL0732]WEV64033.1 response regulator transcription factor [Bifidobacterium sp. ESL0732]
MYSSTGDTSVRQDDVLASQNVHNKAGRTRPLRIAVTDNDNFALMTLANLLPHTVPDSIVIWSSTSATDTIAKATEPASMPDILILDMSLSSTYTGPEVCHAIRKVTPKVKVLGITSYSLEHYAADLADAGAQGLVSKSDIPQLQTALQAISQGNIYSVFNDVHFSSAQEAYNRISREPSNDKVQLTEHEKKIMDLLAQGKRYKQIADEMEISESSIRTGAHRAIKKLGASTLSQGVGVWMLEHK